VKRTFFHILSGLEQAMRKTMIGGMAVLAVVTAAASLWWLWQHGGSGESLLGELDAGQTVAAMELRDLDKLAAQGWQALESLPKDTLPAELQRKGLSDKMGGDPADPAAWQGWGLDPALGLAVAADRRLMSADGRMPLPVLIVRVTDRGKLQAALARTGLAVTLGQQIGNIQAVSVQSEAYWLGSAGERTALMLAPTAASPQEQAVLRAGFEAFLRPATSPLSKHEGFRKIQRESADRRVLAWVDTAAVAALQGDKGLAADISFFASLFPYQATWLGATSGWRVGTTEGGHAALADVIKPKRNPPRCARLLPKTGWAGARASVNLIDLMQGVGKLLPPSTPPATRTALPAATAMLAFTGVGWGEITEAFSGHLCGGVDIASAMGLMTSGGKTQPTWVAAIGVVDAPKADALLAKLVQLVGGKAKLKISEITIQGKKAWQLDAGLLTLVVARLDDAILIAPSATVLQAAAERAKDQSMAATELADALDGDVALSAVGDLLPLLDALKAAAGMAAGEVKNAQALAQWSKSLENARYFGMALRLDRDGLLLYTLGDAALQNSLIGATPLLFGVGVPAFLRNRQQEAQVQTGDAEMAAELQRLGQQAVKWYGEAHAGAPACQFPPSAGPNPPQSCCNPAMDSDGDRQCDLTAWQNGPTWTALGLPPSVAGAYRYDFSSSGSLGDARFTLTVYSDRDCDGTEESLSLSGRGAVGEDGACTAVLDDVGRD
jgi:hypothetical protein